MKYQLFFLKKIQFVYLSTHVTNVLKKFPVVGVIPLKNVLMEIKMEQFLIPAISMTTISVVVAVLKILIALAAWKMNVVVGAWMRVQRFKNAQINHQIFKVVRTGIIAVINKPAVPLIMDSLLIQPFKQIKSESGRQKREIIFKVKYQWNKCMILAWIVQIQIAILQKKDKL